MVSITGLLVADALRVAVSALAATGAPLCPVLRGKVLGAALLPATGSPTPAPWTTRVARVTMAR